MSTIDETPAQRAQKDKSSSPDGVPHKAKVRVEKKSPRGKRCLIEGFSKEKAINACHVCPRALSLQDEIMTGLEYHMDMELETLNLNSSSNIFYANSAAHWMHDHAKIALVPSLEILNLFLNPNKARPTRGTFKEVMKEVVACAEYAPDDQVQGKTPHFTYTLIPLTKEIEDVILVHEHSGTPGQQEISVHRYPYTDFPKIKSHIQPQFVLISLGRLLRKRGSAVLQSMEDEFSPENHQVPFFEIVQLYNHWISAPTGWMTDTTFCDAGKPFSQETNDRNDKTYRPSGSVASSTRTLRKRDCTGLFKVPTVSAETPPSPSRSSRQGDADEDLGSQLERRSKKAKSTGSSSKRDD